MSGPDQEGRELWNDRGNGKMLGGSVVTDRTSGVKGGHSDVEEKGKELVVRPAGSNWKNKKKLVRPVSNRPYKVDETQVLGDTGS